MNSLTLLLTWQTARDNRSAAKKNDDAFHWLLRQAWNNELIDKLGTKLMQRAMEIWSWNHPDHFENDGDDLWLTDYDIETKLSKRVIRIIDRYVTNHPEWQLNDPGDLPRKIVEPSPPEVGVLYPDELQTAVSYISTKSASHNQACAFLRSSYDYWLPADRIVDAAFIQIQGQPTAGLPLFSSPAG